MSGVVRREDLSSVPTFSFGDVERQSRAIVAAAQTRARQIVADAEARAQKTAEARRQDGYAAGLEQGRRAGMEHVQREARQAAVETARADISRLKQALTAGLQEFARQKCGLIAAAESGLIELAVAIARRVCKIHVEASPEPARANIRALLDMVEMEGDIELKVNPAEYELLAEVAGDANRSVTLPATAPLEHVKVLADPAVERGGCVLHTRTCTIDASIIGQLDRIADAICTPQTPGESRLPPQHASESP